MKCPIILFLVGVLLYCITGYPLGSVDDVIKHEHDMLITPAQRDFLEAQRSNRQRRAAIKNERFLWPEGKVYYAFADYMDDFGKSVVKEAITNWESKTCLKFIEEKNPKGYIAIKYDGFCHSYVGFTGRKGQTLSVGDKMNPCPLGAVIHEFGHALGFFHEHSRPDRDEYVKVHFQNVRPELQHLWAKVSPKYVDDRGVGYDYNSIMHFSMTQGNKEPGAVVLEPIKDKNARIGQRLKPSDSDIEQLKKMYKCNAKNESDLSETINDEGDGEEENEPDNGPKPGELEE